MKKHLLSLLGALIALQAVARDFTYTYEGQTITYTVIDEAAKTVMTKQGTYAGTYMHPSWVKAGNIVSGKLVLPAEVFDGDTEYTLTRIGEYAFGDCSGLTSVVIPNSVTSIGGQAFYRCSGLKKSAYPNTLSNPFYSLDFNGKRVDYGYTVSYDPNSAFFENGWIYGPEKKEIIFAPLDIVGKYTMPQDVESISNNAFAGCHRLTQVEFASIEHLFSIKFGNYWANPLSVAHNLYINGEKITDLVIPESINTICDYTFCGCLLTSLTIPNSVTAIGNSAFSDCSGLTSLTIPNSVTAIGNSAFSDCSGLTSVTIGNSITSIGSEAFKYCRGLTSVIIPNLVTAIGENAFWGCCGLKKSAYPNTLSNPFYETYFDPEHQWNVYTYYGTALGYNPEGTIIEDGWIYGPEKSAILYAPLNLTGEYSIPNSVTAIGYSAFSGCSGLTSLTIPNSVTEIGSYAFSGCSGIPSVIIPNSVTSIGKYVFRDCNGIKKYAYPSTLENPLTDSNAYAIEYTAEDALVEDGWVYGPNKYAIYFAPPSLEGDYVMPNTVLSVGDKAFAACDSLTSLKTSSRLRTIGNHAFANCNLQKIAISPTVRSIGENTFANNPQLKEVKIGHGITEIGDKAFDGCNEIENIYITASKPPVATDNTFPNYRSALWLNNKKVQNSYFEAENCWYWFGENMKKLIVADSVVIANQNISGKVGETLQLEASVFPEDATLKDIFWKSTNTDVATVDGNGLVTFMAPLDEECEIVAISLYENVEVAEISVTTLPASGDDSGEGGIEEIEVNVLSGTTIVYDMRGVNVGSSIDSLPRGLYIVRDGSSSRKVLINE